MKSLSGKIIRMLWIFVVSNDRNTSAFPMTETRSRVLMNGGTSLRTQQNSRNKNHASRLSVVQHLYKSFGSNSLPSEIDRDVSPGAEFLMAINDNNIEKAMAFVVETDGAEDDIKFEFEDTDFQNPLKSRNELERILRLRSEVRNNRNLVIDDDIYDANTGKAGVAFHFEGKELDFVERKGEAFFVLSDDGLIEKAFIVKENDKSGESSLKILKLASDIIGAFQDTTKKSRFETLESPTSSASKSFLTLPEQYFHAWNQRNMNQAISVFAENIEYDDTAFPKPFVGIDNLEKHLNLCAKAMPSSFSFVVDDKIDVGNRVMLRWHVENNSEELPYTRGCSWYCIENGKIVRGTDLKEPAVFKIGGQALFVQSFLSKVKNEPIRLIPTVVWGIYIYVVFFSSWFFGLPATSLEIRTWEEVRDLSLNFFLVSPILGLPFSPTVHPGLEAIFNLLLSWAAMFAGFLSDDRRTKPNLFPMLPTVVGMQFLTSAFLLPYLATRSTEGDLVKIPRDEMTTVLRISENRILGFAMGLVGTGSIFWGLFARSEDFGDLSTRYFSLLDLLSIDRVGSSFLVDLAIFGFFQGWLIQDDVKRRGMDYDSNLAKVAKYVPFFGMVIYLAFRPEILFYDEQK
mmetsp:Transcript_6796/g.16684  ORF Transcript_6796/g.16684 Transcript_6796/m.16684 type:complete len:628 (-) Transcript_6796:342-2225(-)|eukprot:CAMPEP_0197186258 /NCGR_PEP_ID=MMETSP1423-20130617/13548_1 /TAXON_ID=476441 /ORGANISM="Pseudo-nitzschia heimii, Strain UNC1101" /LENGTH=627 /DNA_ID=CAMNT_0042637519 /DNA_START=399 /DNA_END=2282 /DNA_ORIENTATION=+